MLSFLTVLKKYLFLVLKRTLYVSRILIKYLIYWFTNCKFIYTIIKQIVLFYTKHCFMQNVTCARVNNKPYQMLFSIISKCSLFQKRNGRYLIHNFQHSTIVAQFFFRAHLSKLLCKQDLIMLNWKHLHQENVNYVCARTFITDEATFELFHLKRLTRDMQSRSWMKCDIYWGTWEY